MPYYGETNNKEGILMFNYIAAKLIVLAASGISTAITYVEYRNLRIKKNLRRMKELSAKYKK